MKKINYLLYVFLFLVIGSIQVQAQTFVTPYCISQVNVALDGGQGIIWAKDLDAGSISNDGDELRFTFSAVEPESDPNFNIDKKSSYKTFVVDPNTTQIVNMYVWNSNNVYDYCSVSVTFVEGGDLGKVYGEFKKYDGTLFNEGAIASIVDITNPSNQFISSNSSSYSFSSLIPGTYILSAFNNTDLLEGVSTLDIVLVQKHLLNIKKFKKPYTFFAADVSNDKIIDILDIIQMRDLILGKITYFPNNTSYRFGNFEQEFDSIPNVLNEGLEEKVYIPLNGETKKVDFVTIKVGNINNDGFNTGVTQEEIDKEEDKMRSITSDMIERSFTGRVEMAIPDVTVTPGEKICLPVTVKNYNEMVGMQFLVTWDSTIIAYDRIDKKSDIVHSIFQKNKILIMGDHLTHIGNDDVLFDLCFDVIGEKTESTPVKFSSITDFKPAFYNHTKALPFSLQSGSVTIGQGCLKQKQVNLDPITGEVVVFAVDLYAGEEAGDILKVNGEGLINFTCDNLGENYVILTHTNAEGTEDCSVKVIVKDVAAPIAVCDQNVVVHLNNNLEALISADLIDDGSFDACSDNLSFLISKGVNSITPSDFNSTVTLDCFFKDNSYLTLKVIDESGNFNHCITKVAIKYPDHQGPMACNDKVLVTLDNTNSTEISADWLLEGYNYTCPQYFDLALYDDINTNTPQPDNIVDASDVGNTYIGKVTDPKTGNSCTSEISFKFAPQSTVQLLLPNVRVKKSGEVCVSVRVKNFNNIQAFQFPISWNNNVINFKSLSVPNGSPIKSGNFIFSVNGGELRCIYDNVKSINIGYNDVLIDICFKAVGNLGDFTNLNFVSTSGTLQTEVVSENGIKLNHDVKSGKITIGKKSGCNHDLNVALDQLGEAIIRAEVFYDEDPGVDRILVEGKESIEFNCDDLGFKEVHATAYHSDGKVVDCYTIVKVVDKVPPVAIVKDHIDITLSSNSSYTLALSDIEIGSIDNCGIVSYKLFPRIIDCNSSNPTFVKLIVTDQSGNSSYAFTKVNIKYNGGGNQSIACNTEVSITIENNNSVEVTPDMLLEGSYNCYGAFTVSLYDLQSTIPQPDNILDASDINKKYNYAVIDSKNGNQCNGYITVKGSGCDIPFTKDNIDWPCDLELTTCYSVNDNLKPEVLLSLGAEEECIEPTLHTNDCNLVATTYDDQVFIIGDKFKIIREWVVIDWNTYNSGSTGIFKHNQIIIINIQDSDLEFSICDSLPWSAPFGDCNSGHTDSDGIEWPEQDLTINWNCGVLSLVKITPERLEKLDGFDSRNAKPRLSNNGCYFVGMTYNDLFFNNNGQQKLTRNWVLIDWKTTKTYYWTQNFTIVQHNEICDTKPWDTPVGDCASGHTLDDIVEWPADITVNNTNISLIGLRNNPNVHENNVMPRIFSDCGEEFVKILYDDKHETINDSLLNVTREWIIINDVTHKVSSYDQKIVVKANLDDITACAYRENSDAIPDVKMYGDYYTTDGGCANVNNIVEGTVLKPSKVGVWEEGLDMSDVVLMYRAILGIDTLSPYQRIAADINKSGSVTTLDAVKLQKIIEGLSEAPDSPSWVFVDAQYSFPINRPLQSYPNSIKYTPSTFNYNFIGIKMGDLNNSYDLNGNNTLNPTEFKVKDELLNKGESYSVNISTKRNYAIDGIQFDMQFDQSKVEITNITCDILPNFSMENNVVIENGKIYLKYKSPNEYIKKGGVNVVERSILFKIDLDATSNGILNECLSFNDEDVNILIAKENYKLGLEWEAKISSKVNNLLSDSDVSLYPQPAKNLVNVKFENNSFTDINYTISNIIGQDLISNNLDEKTIDISSLNNGIYLVNFYSGNRKLIVKKLLINK